MFDRHRLFSLAAALVLGACTAAAEPAARVQADPSVDVSGWRNFVWTGPMSPSDVDPALEVQAQASVARALEQRGYSQGQPPQFAVAVFFGDPGKPPLYTEGPRYSAAPDPRAGQRSWGGLLDWPEQTGPTPGTLTVAVVDVASRKAVWRSTSRAHLGRDATPDDVDAVVAAVLADFPARD
ncbi:DUF4136 domain-containing protein [Caulobacter sp. 17J80-11]|uniref:DUF4136 domain-containing protein n=1 Tax=Caulobacter sp. 17J80-11 TaxID=2763502 RepID=UPI001653C72F|nr:DUF4136 domain-containing protein [Caulobacter sp. 17J80-11]MBC6982136.1 DUF4136 domain-containing protein [Caulobacter sp. 17J80-11]